jgi:hypothetical protein
VWAPNSFKPDWKDIAAEFRFPYPFYTFNSDDRRGFARWMAEQRGPCGVAVNYESSIWPATMSLIREFTAGRRSYVAYDESIWLKNPKSEYKRALDAVRDWYAASRLLSGKPITQGPQDLHPQLQIIGALDGWDYRAFRNRYCVMGGFKGKEVIDYKNEKELNGYLNDWSFLATKRDWSDLGAKGYTQRHIKMTKDQEELYQAMTQDFLVELAEGKIASAEMVITRMNKWQQITSGFIIDDDGKPHDIVPIGKNPKIMAIRSLMANEISGKLIVASFHRRSTELLQEALAQWRPIVIQGQMDPAEVKHNKALFNSASNHDVMIGQIRATKYGHTLLGDQDIRPCYNTAFFENSYSLDDRAQFEDRNHREGQRYEVTYTDFIASEEDRRAVRALVHKEDVASAVLGYAREQGVLAGVVV